MMLAFMKPLLYIQNVSANDEINHKNHDYNKRNQSKSIKLSQI